MSAEDARPQLHGLPRPFDCLGIATRQNNERLTMPAQKKPFNGSRGLIRIARSKLA